MKPDFALLLSFEGICLLHRISGGWSVLARANTSDDTLGEHMAAMRDIGEAAANGPFVTKLIIPNEQIRYVETRLEPGKNRRETIEAALDGATPYDVNDLVYDADHTHPIHIAAVARETLDEAEDFARLHNMNPVCFVSVPRDGTFAGEPFFGPTKAASQYLPKREVATADESPVVLPQDIMPGPQGSVIASNISQARPVTEETAATPSPMASTVQATDRSAQDMVAATPIVFRRSQSNIEPEETSKPLDETTNDGSVERVPSVQVDADTPPRRFGFTRKKPAESTESSITPSAVSAFSSRRKAPQEPVASDFSDDIESLPPASAAKVTAFDVSAEATTRGHPKYLGLILTSILLICLVAVAAWASVFAEDGVARFFRSSPDPVVPVITTAPIPAPETQLASLSDPGIVTAPEFENPTDEELAEGQDSQAPLSPEETQARYTATGIWQSAPRAPTTPSGVAADEDFYVASIDPEVVPYDAVALPETAFLLSDLRPLALAPPPPAGTVFALDDRGFVQATQDGALTPNGVLVFAGRPALNPPLRQASAPDALVTPDRDRLANLRPLLRPGGLVENAERSQLGGRSRTELAGLRPALRPESAQQTANENSDQTATAQAVASSMVPKNRPTDFAKTVAIARAATPDPGNDTGGIVVASANAVATPSIPTRASVARQATVENAINLRNINLIGVYGKATERRALIRLANGRYVKVQIGDRVDGGQVAAIGEAELSYVKRGKNIVLTMPQG